MDRAALRARALEAASALASRPFFALSAQFFRSFFDNELVTPGGEMHVTVSKILALLSAPGLLTFWLVPKYAGISLEVFRRVSLPDKLFYITFSMAAMGVVTVLVWESLFPDRRDFAILVPMPLAPRTIFAAKFTALCAFLLLFFVVLNGISAFIYPLISAAGVHTYHGVALHYVKHLIVLLAATSAVFFFFVALGGVLIATTSVRFFRRITPYVQLVSFAGLLSLLFGYLRVAAVFDHPGADREALRFFPPAWFLGLYETLVWGDDPFFRELARVALIFLGAVVAISVAAYSVGYSRHIRRSLEAEDGYSVAPGRGAEWLGSVADRILVRNPVERAAFYFVPAALLRSRKHSLYFAGYAGLGCALVLEGLLGVLSRFRPNELRFPSAALLSVSLVLSFFLLSGLRVVFAIPAELRANWVFQLSGCETIAPRRGVRKAVLVLGVLPLLFSMAPFYAWLWGLPLACFHTAFSLLASLALLEAQLLHFPKIPFTCSYLPGKANVTALWIFYWLVFTTYAYSASELEVWAWQRPIRVAYLLAAAAAVVIGLVAYRNRKEQYGLPLIFEEQPEPVIRKLDLSVPGSW